MNTKPDIQEGQLVWVEGRRHKDKPDWFSAYGTIICIVYENENEDDLGEVIAVFVEHDDNTVVEYDPDYFTEWNEKNNSWTIRK